MILQGGSDIGITDVSRGRVTLGMSSRDPKPADPGGIVFNKIARDAVCVVTSASNRIPTQSQQQIQDIFSGRVRSWSQVSGAPASGPIDLVVRTAASGTQDAFQNIFMGQTLGSPARATTKPSNGVQAIRSNPIRTRSGTRPSASPKGLHDVPYQGVPCTLRNAKSGQYGGTRNFYFVSRGGAKGIAKKFINFTRKNPAGPAHRRQRLGASALVPVGGIAARLPGRRGPGRASAGRPGPGPWVLDRRQGRAHPRRRRLDRSCS